MKRLPSAITLLSLALLTLLTACSGGSSGGGYSRMGGVWDFSSPAPKAEDKPSALGRDDDSTAQNTEGLTPAPDAQTATTETPADNLPPQRPDLPPVKVALLLPLSGENAKLGEAMLNAAQLAVFDVGHTNFELMPIDTKGTPQGGQTAAQEALQQRAQIVLGPVFAGAAKAAKPVINGAGIPMIAFTTDWNLAGNGTYIMGFMPFDQVERIAGYTAKRGYQTVGIVGGTDDYSQVTASAFQKYAAESGLAIAGAESVSPGSSSAADAIRRLAKYDERSGQKSPAPFQALFIPLGGESAIAVSTLANQYDLLPQNVRRIGTGLWDDASLATEPSMNGAWFAAPAPDAREEYMRRYFQTYGISPPRLSTLSYDATALVAVLARNGLSQGRGPDFGAQSLTNPNGFSGIDGIFRFRDNGLVERGLAILEYKHGNIMVRDQAPRTFQNKAF